MKMKLPLFFKMELGFGPAFAILYVASIISYRSLVALSASEQGAIP
jgi:hypothetical protein